MADRPYINVYDDVDGEEVLVYRQMNDDEYATWQSDQEELAAALSAFEAAPATAADHASASDEIITEKLAATGVSRAVLPTILAELLGEAQSAIPYYENYTLSPDPATAWTNFQALDQATKDRLLYNACRSLAAIMRYLTGVLPSSS